MATKIETINSAYSKMRISGLTVQPTPEDLMLAVYRLEDMMEEFYGRTLDVGYFFEEDPQPNTPTGVKRQHNNLMSSNLATRLCVDFGKDVPIRLSDEANATYSSSSAIVARERLKQVANPSRAPRGSGNRGFNRWRRFYPQTTIPVTDGRNEEMFVGDINDYTDSFEAFLSTHGGTIGNYDIKTSNGLLVIDSALNAERHGIVYRIQARDNNLQWNATVETITVSIVTTTGRVESRERTFTVQPLTVQTDVPAIPVPPVIVSPFHALLTPENFLVTHIITLDATFTVDWGDGIKVQYPAGDAVGVASGEIIVRSDLATKAVFASNTFAGVDIIASSTLTNMDGMFEQLSPSLVLTSFDIVDTSNVTSMISTFRYNEALTTIPAMDTSNVTDMTQCFLDSGVTTFLGSFDLSSCIDMTRTWQSTPIVIPPILLNTSLVVSWGYTFAGCGFLTEGAVIADFSGAETMQNMYQTCIAMTFCPDCPNTGACKFFIQMFDGCTNLVCIVGIDTTAIEASGGFAMFDNTPALVNPTPSEVAQLETAFAGLDYTNASPCP